MKTFLVCLTLSLFAAVASVQAGDEKAPATKPAASADKADAAKATPAPTTTAAASSSDDCCCGSDTACKAPRKVAMSPKAAALLANK